MIACDQHLKHFLHRALSPLPNTTTSPLLHPTRHIPRPTTTLASPHRVHSNTCPLTLLKSLRTVARSKGTRTMRPLQRHGTTARHTASVASRIHSVVSTHQCKLSHSLFSTPSFCCTVIKSILHNNSSKFKQDPGKYSRGASLFIQLTD